jgi:dolichyl-phosphate-mannose--protein O-mannosyl transferase
MATQPRSEDLLQDPVGTEKSAGQLVKEVTEDMSTLIRKEVELAKQEVGASISAKVKGIALFAVVGVLGFFALIFVLLAMRDGFDEFMATWLADLATLGVIAVISVIIIMIAKKKLATPISTELTKKNIKEDVDVVKSLGKRGA